MALMSNHDYNTIRAYMLKSEQKDKPLVSIIIPTFRRGKSLIRTLKSIKNSTYENIEIIIVHMDNLTNIADIWKDDELKSINDKIKIIKGSENLFVAGAINMGIQYAKGEYILICADDVIIEKDTIQKLLEILLKHHDIGIICPVCYYFSHPQHIWWAGSKINMWTSRTYFYGRDLPIPDENIYPTDSFTTIALIRKELFYTKNGKLFFVDQKEFPIFNEEADFSFRIKARGWKVCVTKTAKAYHDIPPPFDKNTDILRLYHIHTVKRAYFAARNKIIFFKKYMRLEQYLIFILFFN